MAREISRLIDFENFPAENLRETAQGRTVRAFTENQEANRRLDFLQESAWRNYRLRSKEARAQIVSGENGYSRAGASL